MLEIENTLAVAIDEEAAVGGIEGEAFALGVDVIPAGSVGREFGIDFQELQNGAQEFGGGALKVLVEGDVQLRSGEAVEVTADLRGVVAKLEQGPGDAEATIGVAEAGADVFPERPVDAALGDAVDVLGEGAIGRVAEDEKDAGMRDVRGDVCGGGGRPEIADAALADGGGCAGVAEEVAVGGPVGEETGGLLLKFRIGEIFGAKICGCWAMQW
jgi:hypothetical protein